MVGRIVALSCGTYSVNVDGVIYKVPARGLFRVKGIKPVVGDKVEMSENTGVISFVYDRISFVKRPPVANIDQMIIIQSLVEPDFSYSLAFKYLTYANSLNIKAFIVLTKSDKYNDEAKIQEIIATFNKLDISVYIVSNKTMRGIEELKHLFKDKISCFIGQTGVGKSSLVNAIDSEFQREVGEYSWALGRGKHQTKEVILLPYQGGYIVDTPGFSSLELDLYKEDLAQYFPGFNNRYQNCYFSDCLHISEKHCEIKKALENKEIPEIAYNCYLKLSEEAIFKFRRFDK